MDTTLSQLESSVADIARQISEGDLSDVYVEEGEEASVVDWLNECFGVEYVVSSRGDYLGARILVTFGGPNIWVDTRTNEVRGYWGSDTVTRAFDDNMGLDEALAEYWECCRGR